MFRIGWNLMCVLAVVRAFPNDALHGKDKETQVEHTVTKQIPISTMKHTKLNASEDPDIAAIRKIYNDLFNDTNGQGTTIKEERTFGVKRIQFMLLPMMYKMGVMMTMLTVLTVISLKGLMIGAFLLVLKLSAFLAKFHSGWHAHADHGQSWSPPQFVHVHVHNGGGVHSGHSQAYSGWDTVSAPGDDENYYYKG
ncbi:uncharacterized protein LOC107270996 [Cephus cinctus]|uniref:Uncharacterized protein LOC107270996 n=1 Tax=Cephus cinctus TaxID=211228 RepID=A0AAJ7FPK8_CEPCN|nr:uncharacterized protein LOC107270996 [Cephus cinctus]